MLACLSTLWLALAGCLPGKVVKPDTPAQTEKPAEEVLMEPLHIGLQPDADLGLVDFDASTLFHEGLRLHEAESYADALRFFDRILSEFPESRYCSAAAYNAGRCLEMLGRTREAIERYRLIADSMPKSKDWVDAMFRLGSALVDLGRHAEAVAELERLLAREGLSVSDRVDAFVLQGEAHQGTSELLRAEHTFRAALRLFRAHEREKYLDPAPAARSEFRLAELAFGRFEAAPLRLPEERMQADLEAKARLLLTAQSGFLRTMRWGDPEWAVAAGYRIGKLYLDLHAAMEAAPVPGDLSEEEAEVYRDMLRKRLAVLLRKALRVFEMTLQLAGRTRSDTAWTRVVQTEMERVEKLVLGLLDPLPEPGT